MITWHVPLTESTGGMIGESQSSQMKQSAVLISTVCGGITDKPALLKALKAGEIHGAAFERR